MLAREQNARDRQGKVVEVMITVITREKKIGAMKRLSHTRYDDHISYITGFSGKPKAVFNIVGSVRIPRVFPLSPPPFTATKTEYFKQK